MAHTPSNMLALGTKLPPFSLVDTVSGKLIESGSSAGAPLLVAFICNHCPFVKHIRNELAKFGEYCREQGVGMVAISPNDATRYPEDSPENMVREAREVGYRFPYLYDESQRVARAFDAACTPEFYLFDEQGLLVYRGQFDDSRPGNAIPVTGGDLRDAVDSVLSGQRPSETQKPSVGCSIKWKPS